MKLTNKSWLIILAAICVVYVLLRFWRLTDSCLWFDEIFSVHAAEHDWGSLFRFVAQDLIHPPLFYVLLKIWISIGGESLFWLRLFPVLFSIVSIIPFYLLCRKLKLDFLTIAVAFAFFAVNGSLIKYAQEVRMYSLLLCLSLFSIWLFVRFLNLGKSFWILTLINILLVYTQHFGWTIVVSEVLAILIFQRIKFGKILLMFGLTLISFVPWTLEVWKNANLSAKASQNLGWAGKPNLQTLIQFKFDLFEPFYYQQSNTDAGSVYLITIPLLLVVLTGFVFYFINRKNEDETERRNFFLLLIFIIFPFFFAFTASWILPFSIWGTRHLIVIFVPVLILSSLAISKINVLPLKIILLYVILLLFAVAFFLQTQRKTPQYIWCAWENLAAELPNNEPAKIYVFEDLVAYHFWFALRDSDRSIQIIKVNGIPELIEDTAYFLPRGFDAVQTTNENAISGEKFWIAFRDTNFDSTKPPLRNLIEKGYKIGQPVIFDAHGQKAFLVSVEKAK